MTSKRLFDVLEVLEVHVVKSEEVRTVPNVPTTTQALFPKMTPQSVPDAPEVLDVQEVPSDEVRIVSDPPTVTNVLFP